MSFDANLEFQRIRDAIAQGDTDEAFEIADRAWCTLAAASQAKPAADVVAMKAQAVCDALDEVAIRESNAGYGRISVPAKELNDLTKAVNELRSAIISPVAPGGEAVAWQWRQFSRGKWLDWNDCWDSKSMTENSAYWRKLASEVSEVEVRPLFAAPAPTTPVEGPVTEAMVDDALHANVPGGSQVWVWLPQADAYTPHETARDVMRCALIAALAAASQSEEGGK